MPKAIRFHKTGGPEVLVWEDVEVGDPGAGQVRIRQHAVGLNFVDVYHRTGLYPMPLPSGARLGRRGRRRGGRRRRDASSRRATASPTPRRRSGRTPRSGSTPRSGGEDPRRHLVRDRGRDDAEGHDRPVPDQAHVQGAAGDDRAVARRGRRRRPDRLPVAEGARRDGDRHRRLGRRRPRSRRRTAASTRSSTRARTSSSACKEITGGKGVPVVYDSVGKLTFMGSLDCLQPLGMMVSFGNASGAVDPFAPTMLRREGIAVPDPPDAGDLHRRSAKTSSQRRTISSTS